MRIVAAIAEGLVDAALTDAVLAAGRAAGLDAVGVAPATPFVRAREALESRKREGLHGGMAFTYKNPAAGPTPDNAPDNVSSTLVRMPP